MKPIILCLALAACSRPPRGDAGATAGGRALIQNKGSDTMVNLAQAWAEEYGKVSPGVAVAVSGGGSGTGIAALINGTVDIANASRAITTAEAGQTMKNSGRAPVQHTVGLDALAVVVHAKNPLVEISKQQLGCIYGAGGSCAKWPDVGVTVDGCADQTIIRVSRQNNSGTYHYFREAVLADKDFRLGSHDMNGSKDVMDLVARTPCAIGYSGMGYLTAEVKALCISGEKDSPCVRPSLTTATDGTYPLARELYMYTLGQPSGATADYLKWILSDAGQVVVKRTGYVPVPSERLGR